MNQFIITILLTFSITVFCYAKDITVTISQDEYDAVATDCYSVEEWVQNAISNKARQMVDSIVTKSGEGSKFSSKEKKIQIIKNLIAKKSDLMKSSKEKQDELENR